MARHTIPFQIEGATEPVIPSTEEVAGLDKKLEDREQRVLANINTPSRDTANKINLKSQGDAEITISELVGGTSSSATFRPYEDNSGAFLGVMGSDPDATAYTPGQWYFNLYSRKGRVIYTDFISDPDINRWRDGDLNSLIPGSAVYLGAKNSDELAGRNVSNIGDVYFNIPDAQLREVLTVIPGTSGTTVYHSLRLLTHNDLQTLSDTIQKLTDRLAVSEYENELGNQFDVYLSLIHI